MALPLPTILAPPPLCAYCREGPHSMKQCRDFHAMLQSIYQVNPAVQPCSCRYAAGQVVAAETSHGRGVCVWVPRCVPHSVCLGVCLPECNLAGGLPAGHGGIPADANAAGAATSEAGSPARPCRAGGDGTHPPAAAASAAGLSEQAAGGCMAGSDPSLTHQFGWSAVRCTR